MEAAPTCGCDEFGLFHGYFACMRIARGFVGPDHEGCFSSSQFSLTPLGVTGLQPHPDSGHGRGVSYHSLYCSIGSCSVDGHWLLLVV